MGTAYQKKVRSRRQRARKRRSSALRRRLSRNLRQLVIVVILLLLGGSVIYGGIRTVLEVKQSTEIEDPGLITMEIEGDVIGLDGVPAYPGSEFMFEADIEEPVVQELLAKKRSAYYLPEDVDWDDIVEFYGAELEKLGWVHQRSVNFSDDSRMQGEYWVLLEAVDGASEDTASEASDGNESAESSPGDVDGEAVLGSQISDQSGHGLRIYYHIDAIWYEEVSVEQAQSGLADRVAEDYEIELLLAMSSQQELPDDVPWKLAYPGTWDAEIERPDPDELDDSTIDASTLRFVNAETGGEVVIEPIAWDNGRELVEFGEEFLKKINKRREEENRYEVVSKGDTKVAKQDAVQFELQTDEPAAMVIVAHPKNGIIYAFTSFDGEDTFWNFLLENIEVR